MNTLNANKLSDEELINYFEEAFEKQIAIHNEITSYEISCNRDDGDILMSVEIIGMAGSPTPEAYQDGSTIKNRDKIIVDEDDLGKLEFVYNDDCYVLNSNDYVVVYKLV